MIICLTLKIDETKNQHYFAIHKSEFIQTVFFIIEFHCLSPLKNYFGFDSQLLYYKLNLNMTDC